MSARPVPVWDIEDTVSFVQATVRRKLIKVRTHDEFEEMVAEGLVILFDLARRYDPARETPSSKPGHVCKTERCCKPSFAGYAAMLLPPKLLDAWHSHHPEHLLRTQPDGSRKWTYLKEACSLDDTRGLTLVLATDEAQSDVERNTLDRPSTKHVGMFMPVPEIAPS
jgi:hypothetical protein